ncbi:MAG: glycosyltransferase [Bacteroidetes bacterium]|nr:MAG: glycosyltransferase [Bacteroidota bacterium]
MNPDLAKLIFVIPPPDDFHSGGNLYNANLINALKRLKVECTVLQPVDLLRSEIKTNSFLFWDTLFLDQIMYLNPNDNNWLIVHHLESLYPPEGYSADEWFEEHEAKLLKKFDGFLVSSDFTSSYLESKGFSNEKIMVIEPALDRKAEVPSRDFEVVNALLVANLQERKGIEPFLRALMRKKLPSNLNITLAGSDQFEPGYTQKCLDLIESSSVLHNHFHYLGPKSPEEIWALYTQVNLFISTAFMETYGMAIQEAASTGLPLLVLNGGNAANHVEEGINGLVGQDMSDLVDRLCRIAKNSQLHQQLAENAENMALRNQYTWEEAGKRLVKFLEGGQ